MNENILSIKFITVVFFPGTCKVNKSGLTDKKRDILDLMGTESAGFNLILTSFCPVSFIPGTSSSTRKGECFKPSLFAQIIFNFDSEFCRST